MNPRSKFIFEQKEGFTVLFKKRVRKIATAKNQHAEFSFPFLCIPSKFVLKLKIVKL